MDLVRNILTSSGVEISAEMANHLVQAVLVAHREATVAMLEAGQSSADREAQCIKLSTCQGIWRAMLNAALDEA